MSFGILRIQKFKTGSVRGIEIHDMRKKEYSHSNPDIDFNRIHLNYELHNRNNTSFYLEVQNRIKELNLKKAVRKDAVVMVQALITSEKRFFDSISEKEQQRFFQDSYDFICNKYGKENIISATVHLDETTPHMHVNFVPVTNENRLSAKSLFTRDVIDKETKKRVKGTLSLLQDEFYNQVSKKYGLERGTIGSETRHLDVEKFKIETAKAEHKNLIGKVSDIQELNLEYKNVNKKLIEDKEKIKKEIKKYRKLKISIDEVDVSNKGKHPFVILKNADFSLLNEQAKAYRVNRDEIDNIRKKRKSIKDMEEDIKSRKKELADKEEQVNLLYNRQLNINKILEQLESKNNELIDQLNKLSKENNAYEEENIMLKKYEKKMEEQYNKENSNLKQQVSRLYENIASMSKAIGCLKYDNENSGYRINNLSPKQTQLIDGIRNYAKTWAIRDGYKDIAEEIQKYYGLTEGMEIEIKKLKPKKSHHIGL